MCEICSKLIIKTPERRQWCRSGVFIVNFKQISRIVLVLSNTGWDLYQIERLIITHPGIN